MRINHQKSRYLYSFSYTVEESFEIAANFTLHAVHEKCDVLVNIRFSNIESAVCDT